MTPQPGTNVTPHHSTAHIMASEQQNKLENRLLHTAVEVVAGTVKTAQTSLM